ncbi:cysteine hydrolase family protein [Pseudonocardia sp. TRM90224]|uniref:cysteine hydrolase family protein n=1 Tax=Pseudonocardia sp. TRM90224 TaxID=2812678 RepID=UPI001E3E9DEE|nr:isochorismatase family protein [Pseudonocardia sp. TRM90224]
MTTALLVIDVQESFRQRDSWAEISAPDIAERITRLVAHARDRGDTVVWVLHTEPGTGTVFDPELGHVRLLPGLDPRDDEPVVHKTSHNAFTSTDLGERLTARGVTDVMVTGIRTEQCCETTARVASDLGYGVTFVLDATATQPLPRFGGGEPLTVEEVLERTASALQGRFAEVVSIDQLLGAAAVAR